MFVGLTLNCIQQLDLKSFVIMFWCLLFTASHVSFLLYLYMLLLTYWILLVLRLVLFWWNTEQAPGKCMGVCEVINFMNVSSTLFTLFLVLVMQLKIYDFITHLFNIMQERRWIVHSLLNVFLLLFFLTENILWYKLFS